MPGNTVTIVEGGERRNIAASHLRLDDLVVVQAGDVIPADLKLVEVRGLEVDEFEITGEIMPVIKKVGTTDGFLYMGSRVLRGAATGMVVAVGERTEYGKVLREAFLCLFQLENPLQPDAHDVIGALTARGIRSIMLTGDRATTAVKGSAACGITAGSQACLTGRVLERMGAVEIARQSAYCSVFAQLMPSQKGFLIRFLQRDGRRVAMVGDGPNDGIALRAADIGISYVNDSSPIARRLAKILIHELADLALLVESAFRIEQRARHWKLFRILVIALSLFGLYLYVFTSR